MEYIATAVAASLFTLVLVFIWIGCGVWRELSETKDHINRLANCLAFPRAQDVLVELCQQDRDLLAEAATNYRRNKPRVKKETV